jgi:crossover junction endodeoxyribonuclease RuvC
MRVLGVDCGSRVTGYGLIEVTGSSYRFVGCGAIRPELPGELSGRLRVFHGDLAEIIRIHAPDAAVFESVFHASNARSALMLGHVRGVLMLTAVQADLPVFEYSALQVKGAVTGYGRAEKQQVQQMVKALLGLDRAPEPHDAADALAVAICHAQSYRYRQATGSIKPAPSTPASRT